MIVPLQRLLFWGLTFANTSDERNHSQLCVLSYNTLLLAFVHSLLQIENNPVKMHLREVVITSVLDEDRPCVRVGGLCKIPPV